MNRLDVDYLPRDVSGRTHFTERRITCPECGRSLPLDSTTECDGCGEWLELFVARTGDGEPRSEAASVSSSSDENEEPSSEDR